MCMFSYATARESTPNIKVNRSKSRNVYMKIISATPKTIKIKIFNKLLTFHKSLKYFLQFLF